MFQWKKWEASVFLIQQKRRGSLFSQILFHNDLSLPWSAPHTHTSISQSVPWTERSLHRTHFSARFPSLSHLSLQDRNTSLILASPVLPNEAPGGTLSAYRLMTAYTSQPRLLYAAIHHIAHNGLQLFIMCATYTWLSGVMYFIEHRITPIAIHNQTHQMFSYTVKESRDCFTFTLCSGSFDCNGGELSMIMFILLVVYGPYSDPGIC